MRTIGFMSILYGKEYLKESLLSIRDHVEKMVVAYTKNPSHGQRVKEECPDTEQEIHDICKDVLGDKFIWHRSERFNSEAEHRGIRYTYAQGYDLILTIDADEVFKEDEIQGALNYAYNNKERYYGIKGYVNFWRSFDYCCLDGFRPIRIENLNNNNQLQNHECPLTIYHFSTAQSEPILRYKMKAFGHASELRKNWIDGIYYAWTPENDIQDIHPVAFGLWNSIKFDKTTLPDYLKAHPNYNKTLI